MKPKSKNQISATKSLGFHALSEFIINRHIIIGLAMLGSINLLAKIYSQILLILYY